MMVDGVQASLSGCNSVVATADGGVVAICLSANSNFQENINIEVPIELFSFFFLACFVFLELEIRLLNGFRLTNSVV